MVSKTSGGAATTTRRRAGATRVDTSKVELSARPGTADTAGLTEDKLKAAAASDMEGSGAFVEPKIKSRIDVDHPAVDNAPRAGQPKVANQIDFNDPGKTSADAVADNLKSQG